MDMKYLSSISRSMNLRVHGGDNLEISFNFFFFFFAEMQLLAIIFHIREQINTENQRKHISFI